MMVKIKEAIIGTVLAVIACANLNADKNNNEWSIEQYNTLAKKCIESRHKSLTGEAIKNVIAEAFCLTAGVYSGYKMKEIEKCDFGVALCEGAIVHTISRFVINYILESGDSSLKNLKNLHSYLKNNLSGLGSDEFEHFTRIFDKDFTLISQRISDLDSEVKSGTKINALNEFFEKNWVKLDALCLFLGTFWTLFVSKYAGTNVAGVVTKWGGEVWNLFNADDSNWAPFLAKLKEPYEKLKGFAKDKANQTNATVVVGVPVAYFVGLLIMIDVIMYGKDTKTQKRELLHDINVLIENNKAAEKVQVAAAKK